MLTNVTLVKYRCFREASVRLEPFTVLVGANAAGKTTLMRALSQSGRLFHGADDFWRGDANVLQAAAEYTFDDGFVGAQRWNGNELSGAVRPIRAQALQLDLEKLRQPNMVTHETALRGDGSNLTNVFASIPRRQQELLGRELSRLVAVFDDVDKRPAGGTGKHQMVFRDRWNNDLWYPPGQVSDGTMLLTAYLLLQQQSAPLDLICIEEPERGLHPYVLGELVLLFRKLSAGEVGPRPVQVVVATHSAEFLDHCEPKEVRFLSRSREDGGVVVEEAPLDDPNWRETFRVYDDSLSALWLSGNVGGVPGALP